MLRPGLPTVVARRMSSGELLIRIRLELASYRARCGCSGIDVEDDGFDRVAHNHDLRRVADPAGPDIH